MSNEAPKLTLEQEFQLTILMETVRTKTQEEPIETIETLLRQEMITRNLMKKLRILQ